MTTGVWDVLGTADDLANRVQTDGLKVILFHLGPEGTEDCFRRWVVDGSAEILDRLRHLLVGDADKHVGMRIVIVVAEGKRPWTEQEEPAAAAALAAVQGIVHSLTLELGRNVRLNCVSCRADASALEATLRFLASDDASFVAGSTFDIRDI